MSFIQKNTLDEGEMSVPIPHSTVEEASALRTRDASSNVEDKSVAQDTSMDEISTTKTSSVILTEETNSKDQSFKCKRAREIETALNSDKKFTSKDIPGDDQNGPIGMTQSFETYPSKPNNNDVVEHKHKPKIARTFDSKDVHSTKSSLTSATNLPTSSGNKHSTTPTLSSTSASIKSRSTTSKDDHAVSASKKSFQAQIEDSPVSNRATSPGIPRSSFRPIVLDSDDDGDLDPKDLHRQRSNALKDTSKTSKDVSLTKSFSRSEPKKQKLTGSQTADPKQRPLKEGEATNYQIRSLKEQSERNRKLWIGNFPWPGFPEDYIHGICAAKDCRMIVGALPMEGHGFCLDHRNTHHPLPWRSFKELMVRKGMEERHKRKETERMEREERIWEKNMARSAASSQNFDVRETRISEHGHKPIARSNGRSLQASRASAIKNDKHVSRHAPLNSLRPVTSTNTNSRVAEVKRPKAKLANPMNTALLRASRAGCGVQSNKRRLENEVVDKVIESSDEEDSLPVKRQRFDKSQIILDDSEEDLIAPAQQRSCLDQPVKNPESRQALKQVYRQVKTTQSNKRKAVEEADNGTSVKKVKQAQESDEVATAATVIASEIVKKPTKSASTTKSSRSSEESFINTRRISKKSSAFSSPQEFGQTMTTQHSAERCAPPLDKSAGRLQTVAVPSNDERVVDVPRPEIAGDSLPDVKEWCMKDIDLDCEEARDLLLASIRERANPCTETRVVYKKQADRYFEYCQTKKRSS